MLKVAEVPNGVRVNSNYNCSVNGNNINVYEARVSAVPYNRLWPGHQRDIDQSEVSGFITFETDEEVTVSVIFEGDFTNPVIRPLSKKIKPRTNGRNVSFKISEPGAYSLEFDNSHNSLMIFVNPPQIFDISPEDENVLYFGPGTHNVGHIFLKDNQTVYISAGAVVYGSIIGIRNKNIRVLGYGILDCSHHKRKQRGNIMHKYAYKIDEFKDIRYCLENSLFPTSPLQFWYCENITVDGIIIRDADFWNVICASAQNITINNIKTIGMWKYNTDGIDLLNCRNLCIKNSFLRNFDDCVVIKGYDGFHDMPCENITVENCVIWCDWGSALELGAETCAPYYENIKFENCDLIHGTTAFMRIHHHNHADIRKILYKNIRCEYQTEHDGFLIQSDESDYKSHTVKNFPELIALYILNTGLFAPVCEYKNGNIHDIRFENISVYTQDGVPPAQIILKGLDEEHKIYDITIDGLFVNGKKNTDFSTISANEFTYNVCLN